MLRRIATSGEGMLVNRYRCDIARHAVSLHGGLLRAAFGVACMTVAAGFAISAARAQTYGGDSGSAGRALCTRSA